MSLSPPDIAVNGASEPAAPRESKIAAYLSLVRFSHTVFALPFAILAAVLAWQVSDFQWRDLIGILVCMVAARTAAMAFNRLADHRLDADNPRTAGRHLPAGKLTRFEVVALTVGSSALFIASTLLFLPNWLPVALSIPVLIWLCGYSFAKRFTSLAHYWLGLALGMAPVATWIAITGEIEPVPLWIAAAVVTWVGGFDILYACKDEDFDRERGLFSIPARLGRNKAFWIARISHLLTVGAFAGLAFAGPFGIVFPIGVGLVAVLLLVEHCLVSPSDLSRVNAAFFTVNAIVSFGVLGLAILDLLLYGG